MATPAARTTFAAVPPEAADVLRPALPGLADEMIAAIAVEVPDYARAMEGTFGQLVRLGVEVALNRFMDMVADPTADVTRARDTYVNLGRGEFHAGRSLDALLAAYRVGARLAWRRFVEAGTAAGPAAGGDVLARRGDLRLHRRDLGRVGRRLRRGAVGGGRREPAPPAAAGPPARPGPAGRPGGDPHRRAGRRLAAAAAGRGAGGGRRRPPAEPAAAPPDAAAASRCPARRSSRRSRRGWRAGSAAGRSAAPPPASPACSCPTPTPPAAGARSRRRRSAERPPASSAAARPSLAEAAASLRRAAARVPARRGRAASPAASSSPRTTSRRSCSPPTAALAADLAASRLAPLAALADGPRARLTETLRAWLDRPGQVQAVAAELGVHPQTVRYRLRQLRELFGDAAGGPGGRFELSLALRVG